MEFIIFLKKIDLEIVELIRQANYSIEENTALCLIDKRFVGFHKKKDKTIVICTKNAKKIGNFKKGVLTNNNDNHKTKLYLRRALRHEATHMIQACNDGRELGIAKNINKIKIPALKSSMKISGNINKEIEAYIMEDKPREVKKAIEKYCL